MASEVCTRRLVGGQRQFHLMKPIHVCAARGVELKYMSRIHHWRRDAYISTKTAFEDAAVENDVANPYEDSEDIDINKELRENSNREDRESARRNSSGLRRGQSSDVAEDCISREGNDGPDGNIPGRCEEDAVMMDVFAVNVCRFQGSGRLLKEVNHSNMWKCEKCGNSYQREKWYHSHVEYCRK